MNTKHNYEFARQIMLDKNNLVAQYLQLVIEQDTSLATPALDQERTKLHKEIMILFGYNPTDTQQYSKTKYLFSNFNKIIGYYFFMVDTYKEMINQFYVMLIAQKIIYRELFETITKSIIMFLTEKQTQEFILGESAPYITGLSPEEFVWIPDNRQHDYSATLSKERLK